jgi:hypothetical protein
MMTGTVVVPLQATGSAKSGWTLRWLTGRSPKGRTYDVQVRKAGASTWTKLRTDVTTATGVFNPGGSGSYAVRARTGKGAGTNSGWSPALTLGIS